MKSVPIELLEELAKQTRPASTTPKNSGRRSGRSKGRIDVQDFIDRNDLEADGPKPWKSKHGTSGRIWVFKKDPMGNGHDDGSCYIIQFDNGAIAAGCHHDSATWAWADLRKKYEPNGTDHSNDHKVGSNRGLEPIIITFGSVRITATPRRPDRKGACKTVLVAQVDGKTVHRDLLDLSSDRRRREFSRALARAVGEIDEQAVHEVLLGLSARVDEVIDEYGGDEGDGESGTSKKTQSTLLIELATDAGVELWHDPHLDGGAYATVPVGNHLENYLVRGQAFREWLQCEFYRETGRAPGSQAMQDALGTLSAMAKFDGEAHKAEVRIARGSDGAIYLDLADDDWRYVRIDSQGWIVCSGGGPKLVRQKGMRPLPLPEKGGSLRPLWKYVNVDPVDRPLVLGWLAGTFNPRGPYAVLGIHGEQGRCKSTTCRTLRSINDPNDVPLRGEPREVRDLAIAAYSNWVVGFDNLSFVKPWLSDALCRLVTGAGYGVRTHYANREETLFNDVRCILLNGIAELAARPDLLDRSIVITLPAVDERKRRTEEEMDAEFKCDHPRILGALLDAVVIGLKNLPQVKLPYLPRMADFATWVTACEPGLGLRPNEFLSAYRKNRSEALASALEANVVAPPLMAFVRRTRRWQGTATDLLQELVKLADTDVRRQAGWPRTPAVLSGILMRLAPPLRQVGISVDFGRSHHPRTLTLEQTPQTSSPPSPSSPTLPPTPSTSGGGGENDPANPEDPAATTGETTEPTPQEVPSTKNGASRLDGAKGDTGDDGDDDFPADSNRAARAKDAVSLSQQSPMRIEDMVAELLAAQPTAPPPTDADVEPDTTEPRSEIQPPDVGPPGGPPENQDDRN